MAVKAPKIPMIWALVTSRCRLEADESNPEQMKAGILGNQRQLGTLAMASAVQLVKAHAGGICATDGQAKQLADMCARNALALTIVGGFIACERVTPDVRFASPCNQAAYSEGVDTTRRDVITPASLVMATHSTHFAQQIDHVIAVVPCLNAACVTG